MRTLAILVLTLFTVVLSQNTTLEAATTQVGQTSYSSSTDSYYETQKVPETTPTPHMTNETTVAPTTGKNATSPTGSSQSPSQSKVTSQSMSTTKTTKLSETTAKKTKASANGNSKKSKIIIFVVLLMILLLLLLVGCIHGLWRRHSNEDDSAPRLLLTTRERLRAGISNLGDRIGVVLFPGSKREGENEEEEEEAERKEGDVEEGGQERDNGGNSGENGSGERSDSSDDYSSLEGNDLRETALTRQEDEANKSSADEEEVGKSVPSDGRHSPAQDQENGKKEGGLEGTALINTPTEEDEDAELCDETIF